MRQGNDVGTQYRSGIYYYDEEHIAAAEASRDAFQKELQAAGYGAITTEILPLPSSTTPRTIISSISPRTPTATAASAARGSAARSGSPVQPSQVRAASRDPRRTPANR